MSNRDSDSNDYNELNERYSISNSNNSDHNLPGNNYDNRIYMVQDRNPQEIHRNHENSQHFSRMNDDDDDYVIQQYRTTSIHRNASNRIGEKPRRLEEHRRWVRSSG